MSALSYDDLLKDLPGTSVPRWTVVVTKIKSKDTFTVNNTSKEVTLKYIDKNIEGLFKKGLIQEIRTTFRGQPVFKANNGQLLKVTDIFKSSDFGGGKGSGGGAEETDRNESAQCLYAALVYYIYKKDIKVNQKITKKDYENAFKYCDVTANFDLLIDLPNEWHNSSVLGANALRKKFKGKYQFHRGSNIVGIIENTFKRINRMEKAFGNLNKWSPADIYMFTYKGLDVVKTEVNKVSTLQKLNQIMLKYYKSGDIVGVSLKKIEGTTSKVTENNIQGNVHKVGYTGNTIVAASKSDIFDSMDVYLNHTKGKVQFRSFGGSSLTGWQGEGKGSTANQGKVSLGPLNFILDQNGVKKIPESQVSARFASAPNAGYFTEFYNTAKKLKTKGLPPNQKAFIVRWKEEGLPWRYSKYLGLILVDRITSLPKKKQDEVMTDIFLYSASKSSFAGPYMKLE